MFLALSDRCADVHRITFDSMTLKWTSSLQFTLWMFLFCMMYVFLLCGYSFAPVRWLRSFLACSGYSN
jgi:hypothetical protein